MRLNARLMQLTAHAMHYEGAAKLPPHYILINGQWYMMTPQPGRVPKWEPTTPPNEPAR